MARRNRGDLQLGRRGVELVLRYEREKVASRGQDPSLVVWIADTPSAADHDIRSIDADGQDICLEVKATVGGTGRFSWPRAEFQLAVSKRGRYFLYRVYEADAVGPKIVEIQDPIGRLEQGLLSLELDVFAADAGPISN